MSCTTTMTEPSNGNCDLSQREPTSHILRLSNGDNDVSFTPQHDSGLVTSNNQRKPEGNLFQGLRGIFGRSLSEKDRRRWGSFLNRKGKSKQDSLSDDSSMDDSVDQQEDCEKDTPRRSLLKNITWRIIASSLTVGVAFLVAGAIGPALQFGVYEFFAELVAYYIHERVWANVGYKGLPEEVSEED